MYTLKIKRVKLLRIWNIETYKNETKYEVNFYTFYFFILYVLSVCFICVCIKV